MVRSGLIFFLFMIASNCFSATDPMQPPEYMVSTEKEKVSLSQPLVLQMVLMSETRKIAVINGTTVEEGAVVSGAKVISISKEKVIVRRKGKIVDLMMSSIKNIKGMAR